MSHRALLDELAAQLYDKEVLFREDLERIFGPRPWESPETPETQETPDEQEASVEEDKQDFEEV